VLVDNVERVQIVGNTFYALKGDNVRVVGGARETEVRNNVLWVEQGYNLYVANDSRTGFFSDYNLLHATAGGKLVFWGEDFTDLLDWQEDVYRFDLHSLGTTVVHPEWSNPKFLDRGSDDYRLRELAAGQRFSSPARGAADRLADLGRTAVLAVGSTGPSPIGVNLLANPGFEQGLSGWTTHTQADVRSSNPTAHEATGYFAAGNVAVGEARQLIVLAAAGFEPAEIDAGRLVVTFGGRVRSAAEATPDRGEIVLELLDADGAILASVTTGPLTTTDRWALVGDETPLVPGTRSLRYTFTSSRRSGTTSDAYLDAAFVRVASEAYGPDLGAYTTAPRSRRWRPGSTPVGPAFPDLHTDWRREAPREIRWDSFNHPPTALIRIDLYQDGPDGPTHLTTVAENAPNRGSYTWIPADSGVAYGTYGLRVQVSRVDDPLIFDRSTETFAVPEQTLVYYVNDADQTGDSLTTAPGSNRHTGTRPDQPKPNPVNLLRIYTLGATNVLHVDAGDYALHYPVLLSGSLGVGDDEGFTLTGSPDPAAPTALRHLLPETVAPLIELNDADFVTLRHLTLNNAQYGVLARNGSTQLSASHLVLTGHTDDGLRIEADSSAGALSHLVASGNGGAGVFLAGSFVALTDSVIRSNAHEGVSAANAANARIEANEISGNARSGLVVQGAGAVVGHGDLALERGNRIVGNLHDGIVADSGVLVVGNVVSGHTGVDRYGIRLSGAEARQNVVHGNAHGILLSSSYGGGTAVANRIYDHLGRGIDARGASIARHNVIYSNGVGILQDDSFGHLQAVGNLIYGNATAAIDVRRGRTHELRNNTIYQPTGDGIVLTGDMETVLLRNNIAVVGAGTAVSVTSQTFAALASDFNLFQAGPAGAIGRWGTSPQADLSQWQQASFGDSNSLAADPLFVDPAGADGVLGFAAGDATGFDDDFHLRSLYGRSTGALAPILAAGSGLPVMPPDTLHIDAQQSPGIDRGDDATPVGAEPAPNGGFVNLGAFGGTELASRSPERYMLVMTPNGGQTWPAQRTHVIRWRSELLSDDGTVLADVELIRDGDPEFLFTIAAAAPNSGSLAWNLPNDPDALPPGDDYRIRVRRTDDTALVDVSDAPITISPPISAYYVNDGSTEGDRFAMAPGNDAHDGLTPASPKASIRGVLQAYTLGAGDVIYVDSGYYRIDHNLVLDASLSGLRIEGPGDALAVLDRANTSSGSYVFELAGAHDVTLRGLAMTGAQHAVYAYHADSDRFTLEGNAIYGNAHAGVYVVGSALEGWQIVANRVYDHAGSYAIHVSYAEALIRDNQVFGNHAGISLEGSAAQAVGNMVYDNADSGIRVYYDGVARGNVVHDNRVGVAAQSSSAGRIEDNRLYSNDVGLEFFGYGGTASGNEIYANRVGVSGNYFYGTFQANRVYSNDVGLELGHSSGEIANNLFYAHANQAVVLRGSSSSAMTRFVNNTVYQPVGDALRLEQNAQNVLVSNNILWVDAGYALNIAADSQVGFQSDYNLLHVTGMGQLARWSDVDVPDYETWRLELGFDVHSRTGDPLFVDLDGADDVLGTARSPLGPARLLDDGDAGFATRGEWTVGETQGRSYLRSVDPQAEATWTFAELTPGGLYQVAVSWPQGDYGVGNYRVFADERQVLGSKRFYHGSTPNDFTDAGIPWETVGVATAGADGTLRIVLTRDSSTSSITYAIRADAVRLQALVDARVADDDFRLQPGSPGIDGGDPAFPVGEEPAPSGGRINLGVYGGTPLAALSPATENIHLLSPNGLNKFSAGSSVPITWLVDQPPVLQHEAAYAETVRRQQPLAYYQLDEQPGAAVAADAMDRFPAAYVGTPSFQQESRWATGQQDAVGFGASDYLEISPHDQLDLSGDATFSFWVRPSAGDVSRTFFALDTLTAFTSSPPTSAHFAGIGWITLELDRWQHLAAVIDRTAGRITLYRDGTVVGSGNLPSFDASQPLQIGRLSGLDDVAIYSRALSASEIMAHVRNTAYHRVNLNLYDADGYQPGVSTPIRVIADDLLSTGSYQWIVPSDGSVPVDRQYVIEVRGVDGVQPRDVSDRPLLIANAGNAYYVNDAATVGDVFTSALGDNLRSGKTPDQPLASINVILQSYDLRPGDVIYVDSGHYRMYRNLVLDASHSGLRIEGPGDALAVLDRANTSSGSYVFELAGAHDVTLRGLAMTGARHAVYAYHADSDRLTLEGNAIYGNAQAGVYVVGSALEGWEIVANRVYDHAGSYAIHVSYTEALIRDNQVFGNHAGISLEGPAAQAVGNVVYDNADSGIRLYYDGVARGNVVHDNRVGIAAHSSSAGRIEDNRLYSNDVGLEFFGYGGTARGNEIYANRVGVGGNYFYGTFQANRVYSNDLGLELGHSSGEIANNLFYAHANQAVVLRSSSSSAMTRFVNNTVYQPVGDALRLEQNAQNVLVSNNILWVDAGYALNIAADSQVGFQSDYNLLHVTEMGQLACWSDVDVPDYETWRLELGFDVHSRTGDPLFVDLDGADDVLGTARSPLGPARLLDDGDAGFATRGEWTVGETQGRSYLRSTDPQAEATWTFAELTPGGLYQVAVSWPPGDYGVGNYRVFTGERQILGSKRFYHGSAPNDFTDAGIPWETVGVATAGADGTLRIVLTRDSSTSSITYAIRADAVRLQALVDARVADDDFRLLSGSPGIDGGDPAFPVGEEPAPSGGRINLGVYGGTPLAALSPSTENIYLLSPNGLNKFSAGSSVPITWLVDQPPVLQHEAAYAETVRRQQPLAYYQLDEQPGAAVAADAMDRFPAAYVGTPSFQQESRWATGQQDAVGFGASDYLEISPHDQLDLSGDATFSFWVRPSAGDVSRTFFALDTLTAFTSSPPTSAHFAGIGWITLELDRWQHLAAVIDRTAGRITLYRDGTVVGSGNLPSFDASQPLQIGRLSGLDDVAIYSRALSASEIMAHVRNTAYHRVDLNLYDADGYQPGVSTPIRVIADDLLSTGSYQWIVPSDGSVPVDRQYVIEVRGVDGVQPRDVSDRPLLIANAGNAYYVNDAATVGDVFTSAPGDNLRSGKTPDQPLASINVILQSYDLRPGDVIYVDSGHYRMYRNLVLDASHSGLRIEGPGDALAVLDRANTSSGSYVFELAGAHDVTLRGLAMTGARHAVYAYHADSDRLTLEGNAIYGNAQAGVYVVGSALEGWEIVANRVYDHAGSYAIHVSYAEALIRDNQVFGNHEGISLEGPAAQAVGNVVYDNADYGIRVYYDGVARGNVVHDNRVGIAAHSSSAGRIEDNRLYTNDVGLEFFGYGGTASGNEIYANRVGVGGNYFYGTFQANRVYSNDVGLELGHSSGEIANNLFYAHANQAVVLRSSSSSAMTRFVNNTVYQPVGDALRLEQNTQNVLVSNNILWVDAGYALNIAADSQVGFHSDYNLIHLSADPNARVGQWDGDAAGTLAEWQNLAGQDAHSLVGDPGFLDIDGADNVLGYRAEGGGYNGGADDNFYRVRGSIGIDRGHSWFGPLVDLTGAPRRDDIGTPNLGSPEYFESQLPTETFILTGTPLHWKADDYSWHATLPFEFPFYDQTFTGVWVSSNGFVHFAGPDGSWDAANPVDMLLRNVRVAPLWDDLSTAPAGKDIYWDDATPGQVTIAWDAINKADNSGVQFSVTLFESGEIEFRYGAGNANLTPTVGISAGDGRNYRLASYDGAASLGDASPLRFYLAPGFVDIGAYEFPGDSNDTTPPTVVGSVPAGIHAAGDVAGALEQFILLLSEPLNVIDARAPAAYGLLAAGPDGLFGTLDDRLIPLTPIYSAGATELRLRPDTPLGDGKYRLTLFGNNTLHDLAGLRLDGNDDGSEGGNYVRDFQVSPNQLPAIESLTASPDPVVSPGEITLTAGGVDDADGEVVRVEFYRDMNGNGIWDPGDQLLGSTLEGSGGVWMLSGVSTAGWEPGIQTLFARAQDNRDTWSDAAVITVVVDQMVGTRIETTIVREPSATDVKGQVAALPASADWVHEWQSFWVEIWVSTPDASSVGIAQAMVDLQYHTGYLTAQEIVYGPAFTLDQTGTINDGAGLVSGIGGRTTLTDVGDDGYVLLARVRFASTGDDQVPVDELGRKIGPYNMQMALVGGQSRLAGGQSALPVLGATPNTELWAVVYDIDGNHQIDFGDFSYFAAAFGKTVGEPDSQPPYVWWADFDKSGRVDFGDLAFFAPNFGKTRSNVQSGAQTLVLPSNFPNAWSAGSGGGEGEGEGTAGAEMHEQPATVLSARVPAVADAMFAQLGIAEEQRVPPWLRPPIATAGHGSRLLEASQPPESSITLHSRSEASVAAPAERPHHWFEHWEPLEDLLSVLVDEPHDRLLDPHDALFAQAGR
jgi:hypothetical protein